MTRFSQADTSGTDVACCCRLYSQARDAQANLAQARSVPQLAKVELTGQTSRHNRDLGWSGPVDATCMGCRRMYSQARHSMAADRRF